MITPEKPGVYVIINHEEQYSLWPANKSIPKGWRSEGVQGGAQECLNYIMKKGATSTRL